MSEFKSREILIISSYPPRECGIATYSGDLIRALDNKFSDSFSLNVCALESEEEHTYPPEVQYVLKTSDAASYHDLADAINNNSSIELVFIQHEFGFFHTNEAGFLHMLNTITAPLIITFHTVLPHPEPRLMQYVSDLAAASAGITVMTRSAAQILHSDYDIHPDKITVIPHGTHLVKHEDKELLKEKYGYSGRKILSTFGLISSGKSIETTLDALPAIVSVSPDVLFLIIGKTHPVVISQEGEKYRSMLEEKVIALKLEQHVEFINYYQPLANILDYLQLTDIYLFTSRDPNQAVSGTFSYAISCACPIVSTPIPHAREVLGNDAGILIDFQSVTQLAEAVVRLLKDPQLRNNLSSNGLHRIVSSAWENVAIAHALIFKSLAGTDFPLQYRLPPINLEHIKKMTTGFGMIQFSRINHPDPLSGYTLDDNARALVAICMHYEETGDPEDTDLIARYLHFIKYCMQEDGSFLNYINDRRQFTSQNGKDNLDDANGRVVWALGSLLDTKKALPGIFILNARHLIDKALLHIEKIHSPRALAFALKGLFHYNNTYPSAENIVLANLLATRLERMYMHECDGEWTWFESYLTYGNSILPEGMLCAYLITGNTAYKVIAGDSFDFLLASTFTDDGIKIISNKGWLQKGKKAAAFGEQPIDVAYTIMALGRFYDEFADDSFLSNMEIAFTWFSGNNHLHQIIYNPCTGGCYDGLEEDHINLNQGAESAISYLLARLTIGKYAGNPFHMQQELVGQGTGS